MRIKLFLLFTILSVEVYSQRQKIDSLQTKLSQHIRQDSLRLDMLKELSYLYYAIDPKKGIAVADSAIVLAKNLSDSSGLATAYTYKGHNFSALGQDSSALAAYDIAVELHRRNLNKKGEARLIYNKGLVYFNQSDYYRAIDCNRKAYEIFKIQKDSFLMAKMLNSMGIGNMYLTRYPKSLEYYLKAKRIYENIYLTGDLEYASINSNIGLLYARLEKWKLAEKYQKEALKLFEKLGFQEGKANAITNLGRLQTARGNPEKAIDLYKNAFSIMENIHNERGTASALTNIGIALIEMQSYKKAIPYFKRTKSIYEKLKNTHNLAIVHEHLGDCYLKLASSARKDKNLMRAEENFRVSLDYAEAAESLDLQSEVLEKFALTNVKRGNFRKAYAHKTQAIKLKDSFNSVEKKEEIARLESQFEYEAEKTVLQSQFEKKQAVANAEIVQQRTVNKAITSGAIAVLVGLGFGFLLYKKKNDAIAGEKLADFKARVAETELKALRSQMNPHFIFNSLNSISDYMLKNDMVNANEYLLKFSKLTRSILENSEKQWISVKEDLELTRLYIELEALRLRNKFKYTIQVEENIDLENTLLPPLLLQPFIENSIWHGIDKKDGGGRLDIWIKEESGMIVCIVDDDGVGRKKISNVNPERTSMGIRITENRLDIIGELKKVKGNIDFYDKPQGLRVELKLPLEFRF